MADEPSQQLCTSCGLCCTGAIYDHVKLDPAEAAAWRARDLETGSNERDPRLPLPCPMLRGTLCSIYQDRPARCRSFQCRVLSRLEEGDIGFTEAADHVRIAKKLTVAVTALLNPGENLSTARRSWLARSQDNSSSNGLGTDQDRRFHLAMLALNLYLDRHFRKPHQAVLTAAEEPAAPPP